MACKDHQTTESCYTSDICGRHRNSYRGKAFRWASSPPQHPLREVTKMAGGNRAKAGRTQDWMHADHQQKSNGNGNAHQITSQPSVRYLGAMIDFHPNFKEQVENASKKAATLGKTLSRRMLNVGGPKQKWRVLLTSVTTSVMTYVIAIWAVALAK